MGQLVKDDFFTLFESVAALEIMDPKMDSGYLAPGETFQDEYDVLRPPSEEEVLGIMDQLLCHEMAWHRGSPLSQSLFTSLYLDKLLWPVPKVLEDAQFGQSGEVGGRGGDLLHVVLRAYCLSLVKCCDYVHRQIGSEHCYEEEDFVTQLYNRNLLTRTSNEELQKLIEAALSWLGMNVDISSQVKAGLEQRLRFREAFLFALASDPTCSQKANLHWDECLALLPRINESHTSGKEVSQSFSVKVQRKLASTVPPRPIVELGFEDAHAHLTRLCQDSKDALRVLDYQGSNNLMTFVRTFQSRNPQPSVYVRALLQSLLFSEMKVLGRMSVKQLLFDDLAETVMPADQILDPENWDVEAPQDPRFVIAKKMDLFVMRATQSYLDLFRSLCQNRSRVRRTLCHTIEDWDTLQLEAEELDIELQSLTKEEPYIDRPDFPNPIFAFPLSSWAYHHKLQQMEWIVQLGFELDVYQLDELGGMYWYLQSLAQTRILHLERTRGFITRKLKRCSIDGVLQHRTTKDAFTKTLSWLSFALLEAESTQSFADGLARLYTFLNRVNLVSTPSRPYSTDVLRYDLRMQPFLHISLPEALPFEHFSSFATNSSLSTEAVLERVTEALPYARKLLDQLSKMDSPSSRAVLCEAEWRSGVRNMLRACIAACIAGTVVGKAFAGGEKEVAQLELEIEVGKGDVGGKGGRYSAGWIVPAIKTKGKK
ncbi:MAG: hypothetical protein M1832_002550 [Thelocarpon impressellum]|nr:MAG: hypothetical protein M1832_002550 [Thelocarpon impressellum]